MNLEFSKLSLRFLLFSVSTIDDLIEDFFGSSFDGFECLITEKKPFGCGRVFSKISQSLALTCSRASAAVIWR